MPVSFLTVSNQAGLIIASVSLSIICRFPKMTGGEKKYDPNNVFNHGQSILPA
jgi:hypothetical protein